MTIYFENGPLEPFESFPIIVNYIVNAKDGWTANYERLDYICDVDYDSIVYTNSLAALCGEYSWNEEDQDFDIYIRGYGCAYFKKVSELYGDGLRWHQDIRNLFISGRLGCL